MIILHRIYHFGASDVVANTVTKIRLKENILLLQLNHM